MKTLKKKYPTIAFLGGSKMSPFNSEYFIAKSLSKKLSLLGYSIVTGGGFGIMEAANKGAFTISKNKSKAYVCPNEKINNYVSKENIKYIKTFQNRTLSLFKKSSLLIFFPGGLGSLNELTELLLLTQNKQLPKKPTILFNENFWKLLISWINIYIITPGLANASDVNYLNFSNSIDETLAIVENKLS